VVTVGVSPNAVVTVSWSLRQSSPAYLSLDGSASGHPATSHVWTFPIDRNIDRPVDDAGRLRVGIGTELGAAT
jgi:hypothetical protein